MPYQLPHSSSELPTLRARRILSGLFTQLGQSLDATIKGLQADCQRMISVTKKGTESLRVLRSKLEECRPPQSQERYESFLRQIRESGSVFGRATQQIQCYDILQQQLAHVGQTYQLLNEEITGLEPKSSSQQATTYLHALPEIIQLHTSHLTQLHRLYTVEIEEWQTQLRLTVRKLVHLQKIVPSEENGSLPEVSFDAHLLALIGGTINSLVNEWQCFRRQELTLVPFSTRLATLQTGLVQLACESLPLGLPTDPAAKIAALKHLRGSYTMQSERNLHDQVLAGLHVDRMEDNVVVHPPDDQSTPSIELF